MTVSKCFFVWRVESVFTISTKYDFKKMRGGVRLGFTLYFYQSHAWKLPNIVLRKSKKPQNSFVSDLKRTDIHRIIDCFLEMWISCKTKQESFDVDTDSQLDVVDRWKWQMTLSNGIFEHKYCLNKNYNLHHSCIVHLPLLTVNGSRVNL